MRVKNNLTRSGTGRELVVEMGEVSEMRGPEETVIQAAGFKSETFSEWIGRRRGISMEKQ